jgi:hypothetical protein
MSGDLSNVRRLPDGRDVCQAVGCSEPVSLGDYLVEWDGLEIAVRLCSRHAGDLLGQTMHSLRVEP